MRLLRIRIHQSAVRSRCCPRISRRSLGITAAPRQLFITRTVEKLVPGGRAGIIVPAGFLCKNDSSTQHMRRRLIEEGTLKAVISLPAHLFAKAPNTHTALLLLRAKPPTPERPLAGDAVCNIKGCPRSVLLIDGPRILGPTTEDAPTAQTLTQLQLLLQTAQQLDTAPDHCWLVTATELAENQWNLSPRSRELSDPAWLATPWGKQLHARHQVFRLKDCCADLRGGDAVRKADLSAQPSGENSIGYFRIGDLAQGLARIPTRWLTLARLQRYRCLKRGDVLFSRSGTIGKAALVDAETPAAIASRSLFVITTDASRLNPAFLVGYLRSRATCDWLENQATRTAQSTITLATLRRIKIPVPPLELQAALVAQSQTSRADLLDCLAGAVQTLESPQRGMEKNESH